MRSKNKVLIVEDEPLQRMLATEVLAEAGYEFYEASSGDEAVAILLEHADEVCFLLTDVNMEGTLDGLALARRVSVSWPWISIVVTSGRENPSPSEMPPQAIFTPKPWRQATLLQQISETCHSSH